MKLFYFFRGLWREFYDVMGWFWREMVRSGR